MRGLVLLLPALVLTLPMTARADDAAGSGRILEVSSDNGHLHIVFATGSLPTGTTVDLTTATLTINGMLVDVVGTLPAVDAPPIEHVVMLVMDTSGSMVGTGLAQAKKAAHAFLGAVPGHVRVGLVAFSDAVHLAVRPTTDLATVGRAVDRLKAAGSTHLFDAVVRAVRALGSTGARSIVLLTDGQDDGSKTTLAQAVSVVSTSRVTVDAVSLGTATKQLTPLRRLARAGHGQVIATGAAADLTSFFTQEAKALDSTVLLDATVPAPLAGQSATVAVSLQAGPVHLADSVFVPLAAVVPTGAGGVDPRYGPHAVSVTSGLNRFGANAVKVAFGMFFLGLVGLVLLALGALSHARTEATGMRRRLSIYTLTGKAQVRREETTSRLGDSTVARSAVELANRAVAGKTLETRLALQLDGAAVPLRPAEWLIMHVGLTLGTGLLVILITGGRLLATLVAMLVAGLLPPAYLARKHRKRLQLFMAQLPDTLQLLAGSLSAGYSFPQAVDAVVREGQDPMASELNRALVENRLGVPLEDALEGVGVRMDSRDFSWVVMAIRIQREVGGNLAEVLTTVAATLRERERLHRQVEVLSAEGRLSANILTALPIVLTTYLILVRPEYLRPLYTDPLGIVIAIVAAILLVTGAIAMRKLVKVDV